MHGTEHLGLRLGVEPVRQPGKPLMQPGPEGDAICHRRWDRDCAEAGDVLVPDLAVAAAGLDYAQLQPALALTESDEHA